MLLLSSQLIFQTKPAFSSNHLSLIHILDHAGIATQAKVDERLKSEGISRYDIGREKFLERAWEWKEEYASTIRKQWAKMGLSLDYSRERFTLDEGLSDAVRRVFVDLYNDGLIYQGEDVYKRQQLYSFLWSVRAVL